MIICRNDNLFILNGRMANDSNGNFTFKDDDDDVGFRSSVL